MFSESLQSKTQTLHQQLRDRNWRVSCAESCTGGLLGALLTEIAGASDIFGRSFVTYSNRAKHEILGVPQELLTDYGAVSKQVVCSMAQNLLDMTSAHLTIAISGIAGPDGTPEKPAGLVHIASATSTSANAHEIVHRKYHFEHLNRSAVRMASIDAAVDMLLDHSNS